MGAKVKVWSLARPTQPTLALVLDHTNPAKQQQQQASASADGAAAVGSAAPDVNPGGTSNMRWLIKSELAEGTSQAGGKKKGSTMPDIVAEAIAHAAEDVPEVMQVGSVLWGACAWSCSAGAKGCAALANTAYVILPHFLCCSCMADCVLQHQTRSSKAGHAFAFYAGSLDEFQGLLGDSC